MKIETKFDLGQEVHKIHSTRKEIRIPCPDCGGISEMQTPSGGVITCDRCRHAEYHGYPKGTIPSYEDSAWHVMPSSYTVGKVSAHRYDYDGGDPDSGFDNYRPPKPGSDKEEYMLWETGVGSGHIHYAADLFATREEAQAECDRRNEEDEEE